MSVAIERVLGDTGELVFSDISLPSPAVPLGPSAGALVYCLETSTAGAITVGWYAAHRADASFRQLADGTNVPITTTIQPGRCYELPAELFGAALVRAIPTTAGQTCRLVFSLKG